MNTEIDDPAGIVETMELGELVACGTLACLRKHTADNRGQFQEWYADPEIAYLLRHDLKPLSERQSRSYFDRFILPLSNAGYCYAIHDKATDHLIGTTALTETESRTPGTKLFRIVIGDKTYWNRGYGTETTRLVARHGFDELELKTIHLEVFEHNPRALTSYERVGFVRTGQHSEWVGADRPELDIIEMRLEKAHFLELESAPDTTEPV